VGVFFLNTVYIHTGDSHAVAEGPIHWLRVYLNA